MIMSKLAEDKFKGKGVFRALVEDSFEDALDKIEKVDSSNIKNTQVDVDSYTKSKVDMN